MNTKKSEMNRMSSVDYDLMSTLTKKYSDRVKDPKKKQKSPNKDGDDE